jgi:FkbM family methyltransferase
MPRALPLEQAEEAIAGREVPYWRSLFPGMPYYYIENYYHHHGLRYLAPQAVLDFVSTRDMIDAGASIGDSLLLLKNYTKGRVISYEVIPGTYQQALKWQTEQCIVLNMGIADRIGQIQTAASGNPGSSIHWRGDRWVNLSTVDVEAERLNLTIGFLKADIEGEELPMLKGAMKTIREQRPVLALSLYHGVQILDVPQFVADLGLYELRYYFACGRWAPFFEYTLLAIPRDLAGESRQQVPL